jgi:hypothetical protein
MKSTFVRVVLVFLLALGLTSAAVAQRQTGSIRGVVVDKDKAPLPGAVVSIVGRGIMGEQNFVTTREGIFRFPVLMPGEYELKTTMPNFKTSTLTGIAVSVGKTTEITIILEIASLEKEVIVVAKSPVVDIQSTKVSVNYGTQFLTSIPMSRDLYFIQNTVPGAIGDNEGRRTSSILGSTVRSQNYALDGVPMNDPGKSYSMANINVDIYDEVEFEVGAHPAEVGQTDGGTYVNIVTKSGGNKFSGGAMVYYTGSKLAKDLFTAEQLAGYGVNPPEKYSDSRDFSFSLGGPIVKDKAWFFADARRVTWDQVSPYSPETRMLALGFTDSLHTSHYNPSHQEWLAFAKATVQLTSGIRYMGMFHYNGIYEPVRSGINNTTSYEATDQLDHEKDYTTTHQFNIVLTPNTLVDLRGTYIYRYFPLRSVARNQPTYVDYTSGNLTWGASQFNDFYTNIKELATGSITHYLDGFLGGDHEIKAGLEYEQAYTNRDVFRANPYYSYWRDYAARNPYYRSVSSLAGRFRFRVSPAAEGTWNIEDDTRRFSAYVQDAFKTGRLSLNFGLRFDTSYQYEPEQTRPFIQFAARPDLLNPAITDNNALVNALMDQFYHAAGKTSPLDAIKTPWRKIIQFTTLSPRLGLVYDIFGTGKTALKISVARYFEPIFANHFNAGNIFRATSLDFEWKDTNKNGLIGQDPSVTYYSDLKAPYVDELMAGVEHELIKDFKLGAQFVYKVNKNIIEDVDIYNGYNANASDGVGPIWLPLSFTDPGWDGTFGTADDKKMTVYGLRADRPSQVVRGANPPEAKREYWAAILTFDKRMSNRWQLKGSILYSSFKGNEAAGFTETQSNNSMFDDPNTLINSYGRLSFDRPWQIKLMGTYLLPLNFIVSAYFQFLSGTPWDPRTVRVTFPSNYMGYGVAASTYTVNGDSSGHDRNPSFTNLDLRLEKTFQFGRFGKLGIYVDCFNLLGRSVVHYYNSPAGQLDLKTYPDMTQAAYTIGTNYGKVNSVAGVRSFRLGARFVF